MQHANQTQQQSHPPPPPPQAQTQHPSLALALAPQAQQQLAAEQKLPEPPPQLDRVDRALARREALPVQAQRRLRAVRELWLFRDSWESWD